MSSLASSPSCSSLHQLWMTVMPPRPWRGPTCAMAGLGAARARSCLHPHPPNTSTLAIVSQRTHPPPRIASMAALNDKAPRAPPARGSMQPGGRAWAGSWGYARAPCCMARAPRGRERAGGCRHDRRQTGLEGEKRPSPPLRACNRDHRQKVKKRRSQRRRRAIKGIGPARCMLSSCLCVSFN